METNLNTLPASPPRMRWRTLAALTALVFALALFCLRFTVVQGLIVSLWLPTALMIALLTRFPQRDWLALLLGSAAAMAAANSLCGVPLAFFLPLTLINVAESLLAATLLRRLLPGPDPLGSVGNWITFVLAAVVFTPCVSALVMVLPHLGTASAELMPERFRIWFLSEALGILTVTPIGLLFRPTPWRQLLRSPRLPEVLFMLVVTLGASYLVLFWLPYPFAFISIALLTASIRLQRLEAQLIFLALTVMVTLLIASGQIVHIRYLDYTPLLNYVPLLLILLPANAMTIMMHRLKVERAHIEESENRFRNAMEFSAIGMALVSPQGHWLQVNQALCSLLGYPAEMLTQMNFQELTHPDDLAADLEMTQALLEGRIPSFTLEKRYRRRDGEMVWVRLVASVVRDNERRRPLYFIAQIEDISSLKQTEAANNRLTEALHEEKERLRITLDAINEAVICTDRNQAVIFMNPVAEKMTGCRMREAQGRHIDQVVSLTRGFDGPPVANLLPFDSNESLHSSIEQSLVLNGPNGEAYEIQRALSPLKTLNQEPIGMVLVLQDVSRSRELMRKLSYNASHDMLTGLPNRSHFERELHHALMLTANEGQRHGLVFLDLDRFKAVNDTAGHAAGDELLKQLSQLMSANLRPTDLLGRLGGDEFGILLPDCDLAQAREVVGRVVQRINDFRFYWEEKLYRIGASAGVTLIDDPQVSASELMSQADVACYAAKHGGRGQVVIYQARQQWLLENNSVLLSAAQVTQILASNQLTLMARAAAPPKTPLSTCFYTLSVTMAADEESGATHEAFHTTVALLGLEAEVDRWLVRQVLLASGPALARKGLTVALPLSAGGVLSPALHEALFDALAQSALPNSRLLFTLEEQVLLHHRAQAEALLHRLKQQGCGVILTQAGHQLNALGELPAGLVDYLKPDARFISQIHSNQMDEILVNILHGTAHRLQAQTLAGPVDLAAAQQKLVEMGIDLIEGEVVAPPQTLESLLASGYFAMR
ncbi:diguanylate cyclase domain-containing protein [Nissabacter sp. SGAir0207]|uniref:diguanylate cyclase domain-containing protein n=1 Tax=Nissabacter sp. SGAir0207 TaxID=2126321 RepID=UPI0010CD2FA2|nr:diguanylate cyclase [Nissabacter sp. SGAir0207]QCR35329.1 hypothetical protein C1N62_04115 [Nissabacter sp. SGAir0207]